MKTYSDYVRSFTALMADGRNLPYGGVEPIKLQPLPADAPRALIFAPHPDDECIIGGLALRLRRQSGFRVINVAVTLGSKKERQAQRLAELKAACDYIGFDLLQTSATGLEGVNLPTRENKPAEWADKVAVIRRILEETSPQVIFFPHERDWNTSHIGVYHLVMDALAQLAGPNPIHTIETEFWAQMPTPNLMVESTEEDVVALVAGTSFHVGEVKRNPYHLMLPAWLADNVRRGTEVVGGQGAASPGFKFATLYRLRRWSKSGWEQPAKNGFLANDQDPASLFR